MKDPFVLSEKQRRLTAKKVLAEEAAATHALQKMKVHKDEGANTSTKRKKQKTTTNKISNSHKESKTGWFNKNNRSSGKKERGATNATSVIGYKIRDVCPDQRAPTFGQES
jgi:hypothetical protein